MKNVSFLTEIIVIGSISLIWIIPTLNFFLDIDQNNILQLTLSDLIIGISFIYLMGIIINYVSDKIMSFIDKKIERNYGGKNNLQILRCQLLLTTNSAVEYMFQRRSLVRLFRANFLNFLIIDILYLLDISVIKYNIYFYVILILFTFLILDGYIRNLKGYYKFLKDMEIVQKNKVFNHEK